MQVLQLDWSHVIAIIEGCLVPKKIFHFEEPTKEEPKEN